MGSERPTAGGQEALNWRSSATLKAVGKDLYAAVKDDKVPTLAAAFAYHTVFALPALLMLAVTLAALLNQATDVAVADNLRDAIRDRAPADTKTLLTSLVDKAIAQAGSGGASLGILLSVALALWAGSNAVGALIEAFNVAYGVEEDRPFLKKKRLTLGLTLGLALFVNLGFVLLVFGGRIGHWIADRAGLGTAFDVLWNLLRWPAAIAAVALMLAVLYHRGPNLEQAVRWVSPGAVLATLLWLLATAGFGLYLRVANPGSAYGAVGSVLVLLFFLYVTGIVFILGAELNALLHRGEEEPEPTRERPPHARATARRARQIE